jgi:hypothetical protein
MNPENRQTMDKLYQNLPSPSADQRIQKIVASQVEELVQGRFQTAIQQLQDSIEQQTQHLDKPKPSIGSETTRTNDTEPKSRSTDHLAENA